MSILIGADFVPTITNADLFISGDVEKLFGINLYQEIINADFRIFNLEVPLIDKPFPILKYGPNLMASTKVIKGYMRANVNLFTLANNHIMDQGEHGLISTIETLKKGKIDYVGAGCSYNEAKEPFYFEFQKKKIGVYACAEHEFSIINDNSCGANPFDFLESFDYISKIKNNCDYLIVLYHGGKEYYQYPSPYLQKVCRKMVEKGANLVICQHSHCIGCEEKYLDGVVVYGQGNFLFDKSTHYLAQTSLLIRINDDFSISYIPLRKEKNTVRIATEEDKRKIYEEFCQRSNRIMEHGFVTSQYTRYAEKTLDDYLLSVGNNTHNSWLYRAINRLTKQKLKKIVLRTKYKSLNCLALQNYFECEAHRELIITGIKRKIKEFNNDLC